MSDENMRAFEQALDALDRGDMDEFLHHVHEDVVWIAARSAVAIRRPRWSTVR